MRYDGDPLLSLGPDGATLSCVGGFVAGSDGLQNAVTLSLFGGNLEDSGIPGDRKEWWGNLVLRDEAEKLHGETQRLLDSSLPQTTGNLQRFEQAAKRDCAWLVSSGLVDEVDARASYPALDRLSLVVAVLVNGQATRFEFEESMT